MPIDYTNCKIYRLMCPDGYYYISSTTNELNTCIKYHKQRSSTHAYSDFYNHIRTIGWDNVTIELLETHSCESKKELNKKEIEILERIKTTGTDVDKCLNISDAQNSSKYDKGKIYKINCSDGHYYIGSTINSLSQRLSHHKHSSNKDTSLSQYRDSLEDKTLTIELIEKYPCNSNEELRVREDYHIGLHKNNELCLNIKRAHITSEERNEMVKKYYEEHKSDIIEKHKVYNKGKKEHIDAYQAYYRIENAEKRRAYSKKYDEDHKEQVLEAKRKYNKENAEKVQAGIKKWHDEHKEHMNAYKNDWAKKKRAANAEAKAAAREAKTAARIAHDNEIHTCTCGGTYQNYRKSRHEISKIHLKYMEPLINP
jgi:hypothetical protein